MYFLMQSGEDGTTITRLTEQAMTQVLADMTHGIRDYVFLDDIPPNDKGYWTAPENVAVIVKGEIVVPQATEVITQYKLP